MKKKQSLYPIESEQRPRLDNKIEKQQKNTNMINTKNKTVNVNENKNESAHINVMYANVDSLSNKLFEVETHAAMYNADIVLITEHLSKNPESKFDNVFNIDGFNCMEENTGRGVCLFYKDNLKVTKHDKISEMFKPSLFVNIVNKNSSTSINIGLVYRSPNSEIKDNKKLSNQLKFASNKLKNLTIFGDFNHPFIDWEYNYCKKNEDHCDSLFLFEITKLDLCQLIVENTHFKPNCKPTLIDLILTKSSDKISNIKHNPPIGKSHHQLITARININCDKNNKKNTQAKVTKPNFEKANYPAINSFLGEVEWDKVLHDKDVNDTWNFIKDKIQHADCTYIPRKTINLNKKRPNPVTMDDTLHFLLKNKRHYFKIYKKYNSMTNFINYNVARNNVSKKIRLMKQDKEKTIAKNIKTNPKMFYQYIASKMLKKEGIADLVHKDGSLTSNDKEKCNILNDFFSSVFTQEDLNNIPVFNHDKTIETPLQTCFITSLDMEKALSALNQNKSPGPDNIHPHFLKNTSKVLAHPFTILFNKTLSEGYIPDDWKSAEVRPIFKKGDKSQPGNYRPVSLTSVVCKVMEGFIKKSLYNHLIDNNILCNEQFGFVSKRNTITQLLVTLNDWMADLDSNSPIDAAYMDFRKAFDSVPHQRLITKLKGYNIDGQILNWITSFLTNRTQYVKINNSSSCNLNVTSGVPQGSVLGPTLFIYFINDLPKVVHNTSIKIFADDTKVYKAIKSEDDIMNLQTAIDAMYQWTQKWLLQFNKEKCKILHLGKNNPNHKYSIGDENNRITLDDTDLEKDLGVYIDTKLDFKSHIKSIVKKGSYASYKIVKNFTYKTSSILVPLFKTLVRPILEYGNNVWSNGLKKYSTKIENVQRKFTKHIKGLDNVPYEQRLKRIKLPSLEYRQHRGDMLQVYKIAHNFYDSASTASLFKFANNDRLRGHNFKLIKQSVNKSKYANFFTNRVINAWNKLPYDIVNSKSINEFKNKFDDFNKDIQYKIDLP